MKKYTIPRVVFAASQSSSGKTTVVTGILRALANRGLKVAPFKIGPDYIDPTYHTLAAKNQGHNLDPFLVKKENLLGLFTYETKGSDIAIIEGVMGLYDGGKGGISSTASISKELDAPVILVLNCKSMGDSAAAIALGFKNYDEEVNIAGVILNCLGSKSHYQMIKDAMEKIGITVLGGIYRDESLKMPERHLGLIPTAEKDTSQLVDKIAQKVAAEIDIDKILEIAKTAPAIILDEKKEDMAKEFQGIKIAIAKDEAFSFYYKASLKVLEDLGAELIFFSPLHDEKLPHSIHGLIIGGGFPELFAEKLASNHSLKEDIKKKAENHLPIYGECGGYMYMTESIATFDGKKYPMLDLIPNKTKMEKKLQTVGYVCGIIERDCIIGKKGETFSGHEFHFSVESERKEENFAYEMIKNRNNQRYKGGYSKGNIFASYLHLHFLGNKKAAHNFLKACQKYSQKGDAR